MSCLRRLATEELLRVVLRVENYTHCSGHVHDLPFGIELYVISGVGTPVTVNIFKGVLNIWFGRIEHIVVFRLSNLADPWSDRHELFSASVLLFEERVFFHLRFMIWDAFISTFNGETLLFVVSASLSCSLITESLVVIVARGVSSGR